MLICTTEKNHLTIETFYLHHILVKSVNHTTKLSTTYSNLTIRWTIQIKATEQYVHSSGAVYYAVEGGSNI